LKNGMKGMKRRRECPQNENTRNGSEGHYNE